MSINKPRKVTDNFEQSSIVPKEEKVYKKGFDFPYCLPAILKKMLHLSIGIMCSKS